MCSFPMIGSDLFRFRVLQFETTWRSMFNMQAVRSMALDFIISNFHTVCRRLRITHAGHIWFGRIESLFFLFPNDCCSTFRHFLLCLGCWYAVDDFLHKLQLLLWFWTQRAMSPNRNCLPRGYESEKNKPACDDEDKRPTLLRSSACAGAVGQVPAYWDHARCHQMG